MVVVFVKLSLRKPTRPLCLSSTLSIAGPVVGGRSEPMARMATVDQMSGLPKGLGFLDSLQDLSSRILGAWVSMADEGKGFV